MGVRQERAWEEHEMAVALDRDDETPMRLVGERTAERGRRVITDAAAARDAVPAMALVEIPQLMRPGDADAVADQRPILVLDLGIELGAHAAGCDRARIPADRRIRFRLLD